MVIVNMSEWKLHKASTRHQKSILITNLIDMLCTVSFWASCVYPHSVVNSVFFIYLPRWAQKLYLKSHITVPR